MRGIQIIFQASLISMMVSCGSKDKTPTYAFDTDINPIMKNSCAGNAVCHGTGENGGNGLGRVYVDNKDFFIADKEKIKTLIALPETNSEAMPKPGYGISLSASDKAIILAYLDQSTQN